MYNFSGLLSIFIDDVVKYQKETQAGKKAKQINMHRFFFINVL